MAKTLSSIVYKSFTFPYNPTTSTYKIDRTYIKHKYPELAGNELEDFGPNACIITGSGTFFGDDAYLTWNKLLNEFKAGGVGNVSHPIFTDIRRGLMTSLYGTLEPSLNSVQYTFEIVADIDGGAYNISNDITVVSTNTKDANTSNGDKQNSFIHTVVSGEYLAGICAMYAKKYNTTISWQKIAEYNNMKNPQLIHVGDKIKIYYPTDQSSFAKNKWIDTDRIRNFLGSARELIK